MSIMSKLTAAYVAGLIDGEGSLEIRKRDNRKYEARIRVCLTHKELITWLQNSFGGWISKREFNNDNWNDAYSWCIKGNKKVLPFIEKIYPYLKIKKKHAEVIKRFLKTFNSNSFKKIKNKSDYHNGHHLELKDEIIEKRDNFYHQIKELNKRGKYVQPERLSKVTSLEEAIV